MARRRNGKSPSDSRRESVREVEREIEDLGDPEAGPSLPSTTLAAQAVVPTAADPARRFLGDGSRTREILLLSWPVMLSQALIAMTGLVDRAMVGRLGGEGDAAVTLAAVGFATHFFFLIQAALFAVGMACVALMARAIGAKDPARARAAMAASLEVAVVTTAVLTGALFWVARPALGWLGATDEVANAALPYLELILASSLGMAVALLLESALRANRDMRTPMWIAGIVTITKLGGNALLIFGYAGFPRLELVGAGLATLISQVVAVVFLGIVIARANRDSPVGLRIRDWQKVRGLRLEVIRIALPSIAERLLMNAAMLIYFWILGHYYGTVSVAAYTVGVALLSLSWVPGTGYAQACATLVGQALGAGRPREAIRIGWRCAGLALGTAVILGVVFALSRTPLAELFTDDPTVIAALGPFMLTLAVAQPFLQVHFTLAGAHRGAGDTWTPLVAAAVGNWVFRVPLALLCAITLETSVEWIWYAIVFDHVSRAGWLTLSFARGRFLTRY
ncbi:MAG: MATE family efflux transporter [Myxococcota bacterium]